ncbi:mechanosensitive ion channel family protein [Chrysiogenes arsenatis]|uniref:mechanosensitive ion channel family protein n=1 Tax=Chrysiogenes arsenatis TaxID=309797 RepID=UPI0003F8D393|nr:mechanosensitive ion channel domain-containing protein [Chrysiogenes arsenatis]
MDGIQEFIATMSVAYGMKILGGLAILIIGWWVVKRIASFVGVLLERTRLDPMFVRFLSNFVSVVGHVVVVIAALGNLGVNTNSVLAVLGAAGLAIGLSLKDSLSHLASGILIAVLKLFRIGDFVDFGGKAGTVLNTTLFHVELKTPDGRAILVPNAEVIGGSIINFSQHPQRRVEWIIGVSYRADVTRVKEVLKEVINRDERVKADPEPFIAVHALDSSSVNFVVRAWTDAANFWPLYFNYLEEVKIELDKQGIEIPFPQRDVHLHPSESLEKLLQAKG